jgi:galactokinase
VSEVATRSTTSVASPPPPSRSALLAELAALPAAASADLGRAVVVRAPGRVNLIGEHTDYNGGFVLPVAIDLEIRIAFAPAASDADRRVTLASSETGDAATFELGAIGARQGSWIDYAAGTALVLQEAGIETRAGTGLVASTLPPSSGLSSSAALELASAWAIASDAASLDPLELARLCQRAENTYVGVRSGLMDQFASAMGRPGAAVLLDCRSLAWRAVPLPLDRVSLLVVHSGSTRALDGSAYNERREQCERGVAVVARRHPEVHALRDVTLAMLDEAGSDLDDDARRRAEHVVRENERVLETVAALEAGDLDVLGRLLVASHDSLRDLFEVSSPALDALVEIATAVEGVFGARMTGGGFGGCAIALVRPDAVDALAAAIRSTYPARTGLEPRLWAVTPSAGAGVVRA